MDTRTLTGKAIATLIAAVVVSALATSFSAPHAVQGIADVAVLLAFAFAGVAMLTDRRKRPAHDHIRTSGDNSSQDDDHGQEGPAR